MSDAGLLLTRIRDPYGARSSVNQFLITSTLPRWGVCTSTKRWPLGSMSYMRDQR